MHASLSKIWLFKGTARLSTFRDTRSVLFYLEVEYTYSAGVYISRLAIDIRLYGTLSSLSSTSKSDQPEPPKDTSSSSDSDFESD